MSELENALKIYVIRPRFRIRWSSPSVLGFTSALNSFLPDYAPIGHFAVEMKYKDQNTKAHFHILTGMEREDKVASRKLVLKKKLGLGSFFYSFKGSLQSAVETRSDIDKAKKQKRLKVIEVPLTDNGWLNIKNFLDLWINQGSYTVYGGNKKTLAGEGAGCADFAETLFYLATGENFPDTWIVNIKVPNALIGDGQIKKISFLKILTRMNWFDDSQSYRYYRTADTNKVYDSISECHSVPLSKDIKPISCEFKFQYVTPVSSDAIWDTISVK